MRIHLGSSQVVALLAPLLLWGGLQIYSQEAIQYISMWLGAPKDEIQTKKQTFELYGELYRLVQENERLQIAIDNEQISYLATILGSKKIEMVKKDDYEGVVAPTPQTYKLSFVILGRQKRAMINNTLVKEGDEIEGAKVLLILKDRVKINTNEGEKWLKLFE